MIADEVRANLARVASAFLLILASFGFFAAPAAFAQGDAPVSVQALTAEDIERAEREADLLERERLEQAEETETPEIVVTGSRIKRSEFNSSAPIQVITNERSQLAGLLDSSEILQGSTIAAGQQINNTFSGFNVDGGTGSNSISLRGLGAQRTLVLVNGKRWGPSGVRGSTNSVDLTALPTSQIARYEILKDGASSVYGADAVAGVVNAFTKERIDGGQLNVQYTTPENGGESYSVDAAWGRVGDNWSFNVSGIYGERKRTVRDDFKYAACDHRPRTDGANRDPVTGKKLCFGMIYGLQVGPFGFVRYEPSLTDPADMTNPFYDPEIQGDFGIPYWTSVGINSNPNQGGFYRDEREGAIEEIAPPGDITSLNSFGDVDFSIAGRGATAYYEFYYNRRTTDAVQGYRQFFPFVPPTNPTNIMGLSGPLAGFGGFGVQPVLPSYEIQDPTDSIDVERTNTFIGLKGDISSTWTYDAYIGHSWSDGDYVADNWLDGQVNASLDADFDAGGNLVCSAASLALYPDCVAGDLFTEDALLRGILPQNYLDFIGATTKGNTVYKSQQFSGFATGRLFDLPAGEVQGVFGYEFRKEEIDDEPDINAQTGNIWGSSSAGITKGDDTVNEFFFETELPLFRDTSIADELVANASWRFTDYDSYGDDDTYRVSLDWQMNSLVRVRGTQGTSFRAPDLFEQFLGNETGFLAALGRDPCIDYGTNYDPSTTIYQNCAAVGLAEDFGTQGTSSIRTVTGGNQELEAETSDAHSVGIIFTPEFVGASLSVNWFSIELENTVASPSTGFVVFDCYNSENFSSGFCDRVSPRDPVTGFLTDVDASLLNVGLQRSKGVDIDFLYEREFSSFDLSVDVSATHISTQDSVLLGEYTEEKGHFAFPENVAQADIRADYRDWTFFYSVDWIGETKEPQPDGSTRICETPAQTYHTVSTRYRTDSWEIIGTVRNLADKKPPLISDNCGSQTASQFLNTIPGGGYELLGRHFALQVALSFDL